MKTFIQYLNEYRTPSFMIQIGFKDKIDGNISSIQEKYKLQFYKTDANPININDRKQQYRVVGSQKNVKQFLKDYNYDKEYYTTNKYVLTSVMLGIGGDIKDIKTVYVPINKQNDVVSQYKNQSKKNIVKETSWNSRLINILINKLKQSQFLKQNTSSYSFSNYSIEFNKKSLSIRDLGIWEIPEDEFIDSYDDYDWKIPSKKTSEEIEKVVKKFEEETNLKINLSFEEKNYTIFTII